MKIIQIEPNLGGSYPAPQSWSGAELPEGYAKLPDDLDMSGFYAHNGFVTLEIEGGVVTGYTPDIAAWEAWKASLPPEPEAPEPKTDAAALLDILLGVTG
jgi:hypothetical protein